MDSETTNQYGAWNEQKKLIVERNKILSFKEREIWWCSLGLNVGRESYGKGDRFMRPVLILRKLSADTCVVLPITSKRRENPYFVEIIFKQKSKWVMLHQIRFLDSKRFQYKKGRVDNEIFGRIKEKLETLLELSDHHPVKTTGINEESSSR